MLWELVRSSLGVRQKNQEAHWEHIERSSKEDRKTRRKNAGGYLISGSSRWRLDRPGRWLYRSTLFSREFLTATPLAPMVIPYVPDFFGCV
ncbi:hypothetical protein BHM03_00036492 [Ensete ventricosum]|uniref:Uncharacterized protein n=1 Tax=Ensete ventricosum TaxID=4639 RepID=A0A426ZT46_ENSVE|nr:hypothetical protein B296_00027703 [Ensete ventricosum]RZS05912.1 hypothetical protein BHM03_00036492 [Ensete ventricosum]